MTSDVRLAIVGSTKYVNDPMATALAREVIEAAITFYDPVVVISGGAVGIDTIAAEVARRDGVEVIEHLPRNPRWKPDGYEERNLLIARDCTHLLCIRHPASTTYGSGWTADQAEAMGKVVHRRSIPPT